MPNAGAVTALDVLLDAAGAKSYMPGAAENLRAAVANNSPVCADAVGDATEMLVSGDGSPSRLADCINVARSACILAPPGCRGRDG